MTTESRPPAAARIQGVMELLLRAGVIGIPLMCLAGMFLITAGTDETFMQLQVRGLVDHGKLGDGSHMHSSHTLSTSGPYTAITAVLSWAGRGTLQVIRLISPLALVGLIFLLLRLADRTRGRRDPDRWIVAASILMVHGLFMLGSTAYGEVLATTLVIGGAIVWTELPPGTWRRRLATGAVLGLAAACRLNCLPALVALGITWLSGRGDRRTEFRDTAVAVGTGLAAFLLQWTLFVALARDPLTPSMWMGNYGLGPVGGDSLAYLIPKRLVYFVVGQDHLAGVLALGITAGWCAWARQRALDPRAGDLILAFAWIEGVLWYFRAPISHLRYLWPSLVSFAVVGGLTLAAEFRAASEKDAPMLRLGALAVALGAVLTGYVEGGRIFLHGEGDLLSFEYQRTLAPNLQYGPFKYVQHQRAAVRHLKGLPADQGVATFAFDTALAFQTRRPILPIACYYAKQHAFFLPQPLGERPTFPRWLVVTPLVNRHPDSKFTPQLHDWVEKNCRLEARYGPYLLYEVRGPWPSTGEVFHLALWEPAFPGEAAKP